MKGDQLFDIICVGIFACTVLFLKHLNAGAIYFWIKDLTQEFLKLQVIYTAVEMFDKVMSRIYGSTLTLGPLQTNVCSRACVVSTD